MCQRGEVSTTKYYWAFLKSYFRAIHVKVSSIYLFILHKQHKVYQHQAKHGPSRESGNVGNVINLEN